MQLILTKPDYSSKEWADIPADWECPDCGVAKSDFEMVEI